MIDFVGSDELNNSQWLGKMYDPLICLPSSGIVLLRMDPFVPSMHHFDSGMLVYTVKRPSESDEG